MSEKLLEPRDQYCCTPTPLSEDQKRDIHDVFSLSHVHLVIDFQEAVTTIAANFPVAMQLHKIDAIAKHLNILDTLLTWIYTHLNHVN